MTPQLAPRASSLGNRSPEKKQNRDRALLLPPGPRQPNPHAWHQSSSRAPLWVSVSSLGNGARRSFSSVFQLEQWGGRGPTLGFGALAFADRVPTPFQAPVSPSVRSGRRQVISVSPTSVLLGIWAPVGGAKLGSSPFPAAGPEAASGPPAGLSFPSLPAGAGTPRARVPGAQPPAAARWAGRMTSPGRGRGGSGTAGRERDGGEGLLRARRSARSGSVGRPRP